MDEIIKELFRLSDISIKNNEFPVSAIIFDEDYNIISSGYNCRNETNITVNHAEIIAITEANKIINNWQLSNMCMIVTLEPCDMCKHVINEARMSKVLYLVPRYKFKKSYKGTLYKHLNIKDDNLDSYIKNIKNFFKDKR